jgi:indolepyruvate decarboxylase
MGKSKNFSIGTYLTTRLEQLGITHLFAVPGDYTSELLEIIDQKSKIEYVGTCNELNAGYAADGYARIHGIGAVSVTSGVGAFSLLNAVGGSYVESYPLVVIIGTPSNTSKLLELNAGKRFHHQINTSNTNKAVYTDVTVTQKYISDPLLAPWQIDDALVNCISYRLPVLIEFAADCYHLPCRAPIGKLVPISHYMSYAELKRNHNDKYTREIFDSIFCAVEATYEKLRVAKKPVLWLGHEITIYNLHDKIKKLLKLTNIPFITSLLAKSVLSEDTSNFAGVYEGAFTNLSTNKYANNSDCVISIGVWNTDINTLGDKTRSTEKPATVFASRDVVRIDEDIFVNVSLENFLDVLIEMIEKKGYSHNVGIVPELPVPKIPQPSELITYDNFFAILNNHLDKKHIVVSDMGLSSIGGSGVLHISKQQGYHIQGFWASIGWSVPAGLGMSFLPDHRTIVIVGDGAFNMTCQEISSMIKTKRNTVIFVMNNGVYGIEQMFTDPSPFKRNKSNFERANILPRWDYCSLMKAFSNNDSKVGQSATVHTVDDLQKVLQQIVKHSDACWLVDIRLSERDFPSIWSSVVYSDSEPTT